MDSTRWARFAPLAGVLAVVLFVIGAFVGESGGGRPDDGHPAGLLAWFRDDTGTIFAGNFLFVLGALLLMWFFGALRSALRTAEGGSERLSAVAFGTGLIASAALIMSAAPTIQGAISHDDLVPESAQTLALLSDAFFGVAEFVLVPMFVAVGLLSLQKRVLPVWLGCLSLVIALVLLIVPIGWLAVIFLFPLWTLVVSWLLFARQRSAPAGTSPAASTPVS